MMLHEYIFEDMRKSRSNGSEQTKHLRLLFAEQTTDLAEESSEQGSESDDEDDQPTLE